MAGEAEKKATAVKDKANGTNPKSTAEKSGESRTNGTDNNKSEGKKVGKTPSVRFSPDTKPASKRRPKPSTPPRSVKRSYIGKANLKRDIPIFLGIMAFLLWVAISTANVGKPKPKNKKGLKNMKKELSNIAKAYQKDMEGRRRSTECGIFLGSSSIPSAGISWFAGKLFQEGDVVLDASATQSIGGRDVPESAFSLKHHPHISNVRFDGKAYRATRLIGPGDEIFLPFEEHPHSFVDEPIFRTIPTASDFQQAEEIFTIEAETQIPQTLRENRALMDKIPKRGRINNSAGGNDALKMVKQSVALFSEVVAALLPITLTYVKDLFQYEGEFSHAVLRNRTIYWLEIHGHCMGDVQVEDGKVIAKRLIKKGSRIMVAPLYIKEKPETCLNGENECTNTGSTCLTHEGSKLLVCPLASSLKYSSNSGTANADYSWGQWNTFNYAANNRKSADEILSYHSNGMSMDIIATQDINNGDEIVVAVEENARNSFGVRAKDGFFRKEWITETVAVDPPIA